MFYTFICNKDKFEKHEFKDRESALNYTKSRVIHMIKKLHETSMFDIINKNDDLDDIVDNIRNNKSVIRYNFQYYSRGDCFIGRYLKFYTVGVLKLSNEEINKLLVEDNLYTAVKNKLENN